MDDFSLEEIRKKFEAVMDVIRCAVCLETVRQELVHCVNGHLLCSECKGEMADCPTCRGSFSEDKLPISLLQVIEALPKRCKYNNCPKYLKDEDNHEKYCGFKPTKCLICDWNGPGKDILNHIKEKHSNETIFTGSTSSMVWKNFDPGEKRNGNTVFFVFGHFFWESIHNDPIEKTHIKTFHLVPNGKALKDLCVKYSFVSDFYEFSAKIKLNLDPDANPEDNCICVPWRMLPHFVNNENALKYTYYVTQN